MSVKERQMVKAVEEQQVSQYNLPAKGFVRIWQILGDKKRGVPPLVPISKSAWWAGVACGRYPKSLKLSEKCTVWRVEDILALLAREV